MTPVGVALCLVAALLYAGGVTLQKPVLRNVSALQVTWLACLVGAIACLPFAPGLLEEARAAEPVNLAWIVFLGIFPTSIGFTTWAYALARMSAGRAGAMTYLIPPTAIVISWLLLGETPPRHRDPGRAPVHRRRVRRPLVGVACPGMVTSRPR